MEAFSHGLYTASMFPYQPQKWFLGSPLYVEKIIFFDGTFKKYFGFFEIPGGRLGPPNHPPPPPPPADVTIGLVVKS